MITGGAVPPTWTLTGHTGAVYACAISPDCSFVLSASRDNTLKIWDAATGEERVTLTGHTNDVRACAISPDSSFVVSASNDETLKIWDAVGKERVNPFVVGPPGNRRSWWQFWRRR